MKESHGLVLRQRSTVMPRSLECHGAILQAIAGCGPDEAARQMQDHIRGIEAELNVILKEPTQKRKEPIQERPRSETG